MATLEVVQQIVRDLDGQQLVHMRIVSPTFEAACRDEWKRRVHHLIQRYFVDVTGFFKLLGSVEGLVSGSVALAVLLWGSDKDNFLTSSSDIDIYVPNECARDAIVVYLVRAEGYSIDNRATVPGDYGYAPLSQSIVALNRLIRTRENTSRRVDIIVGAQSAATLPLTSFWSSLVMNYISETSIVSLYPNLTLQGRFFTTPHASEERLAGPLAKYTRRGFVHEDFVHTPRCAEPTTYCPGCFRVTEDHKSLRVEWQSRCGPRLPYGVRAPCSVPASAWKWTKCTWNKYEYPFVEESRDGRVVKRL